MLAFSFDSRILVNVPLFRPSYKIWQTQSYSFSSAISCNLIQHIFANFSSHIKNQSSFLRTFPTFSWVILRTRQIDSRCHCSV